MKKAMIVRLSDGLVVNTIIIDENSEYPIPDGYTLLDLENYEEEVEMLDEESGKMKKVIIRHEPEPGTIIDINTKRIKGKINRRKVDNEFVNFLVKQHKVLVSKHEEHI